MAISPPAGILKQCVVYYVAEIRGLQTQFFYYYYCFEQKQNGIHNSNLCYNTDRSRLRKKSCGVGVGDGGVGGANECAV